jgi:hypothetical protein
MRPTGDKKTATVMGHSMFPEPPLTRASPARASESYALYKTEDESYALYKTEDGIRNVVVHYCK